MITKHGAAYFSASEPASERWRSERSDNGAKHIAPMQTSFELPCGDNVECHNTRQKNSSKTYLRTENSPLTSKILATTLLIVALYLVIIGVNFHS